MVTDSAVTRLTVASLEGGGALSERSVPAAAVASPSHKRLQYKSARRAFVDPPNSARSHDAYGLVAALPDSGCAVDADASEMQPLKRQLGSSGRHRTASLDMHVASASDVNASMRSALAEDAVLLGGPHVPGMPEEKDKFEMTPNTGGLVVEPPSQVRFAPDVDADSRAPALDDDAGPPSRRVITKSGPKQSLVVRRIENEEADGILGSTSASRKNSNSATLPPKRAQTREPPDSRSHLVLSAEGADDRFSVSSRSSTTRKNVEKLRVVIKAGTGDLLPSLRLLRILVVGIALLTVALAIGMAVVCRSSHRHVMGRTWPLSLCRPSPVLRSCITH